MLYANARSPLKRDLVLPALLRACAFGSSCLCVCVCVREFRVLFGGSYLACACGKQNALVLCSVLWSSIYVCMQLGIHLSCVIEEKYAQT